MLPNTQKALYISVSDYPYFYAVQEKTSEQKIYNYTVTNKILRKSFIHMT